MQILAGIYKAEEGELYFNGIPMGNYRESPLHDSIGLNLPVNQVFEGTFKENILMGRNCDESRLTYVLELLNLNEYLIHQPQGIDSMIDSGGRRLPRSIIQKIQIARLIIHEPKLLLLEDPLQFIEASEKEKIINYLMHKDRNWTLIVISDFGYWKTKCDRVIRLGD